MHVNDGGSETDRTRHTFLRWRPPAPRGAGGDPLLTLPVPPHFLRNPAPRLDPSVLRFPHLEFENTHVAGLLIRANKTRPGPDLCEAQGACKCWPCPLLCEEAGGLGGCWQEPTKGRHSFECAREDSCPLCGISTCQNLSFGGKMCGIWLFPAHLIIFNLEFAWLLYCGLNHI